MRWSLFVLLSVVSANPTYAGQCDAEGGLPPMGGTLDNTGWSVSVTPSTGFTNGAVMSITVTGPTASSFLGIQMYVEDPTTNTKYGSWGSLAGYQVNTIACRDGPAFCHNSNAQKLSPVTFSWTAPATDPGAALAVRVLLLWSHSPYHWAQLTATIPNANTKAPSKAPSVASTQLPTTGAPTKTPTTVAPTLIPTTVAPTLIPTTVPPTPTFAPSSAPSSAPSCTDGLLGPTEIGIDCGGPCPACPSYVWRVNAWTPCSVPCGGGTQTRSVECINGTSGDIVITSYCSNSTHPAETSVNCNPDPCPTYSWSVGAWGSCSSPCGGGTEVRSVDCLSSVGNVTVNDTYCGSVTKPFNNQDCNTNPCNASHWVSQPWGQCSATCGGGSQTRTVQCYTSAGSLTNDNECTDTKPDTQQMCNTNDCTTYVWNPCPTFYPCTATCNGGSGMLGVRYKDVFCANALTLETVDPSLCNAATKPITNYSSCNPEPCTGPNWMANGNWGPCEQSDVFPFNYVRNRTFHCHNSDGSNALSIQCANVPLPLAVLNCTPNTCLVIPGASVSSASSFGISCVLVFSFLGIAFVF